MRVEGKTKIIQSIEIAEITTKNDITAGDGAKHDILPGKAELSTRTTCNIFELLRRKGVATAYIGPSIKTNCFYAHICEMIPVEVVIRGVATGSFIKRNSVKDGTVLTPIIVEFYYKTSGKKIATLELPCDDPLMIGKTGNDWQLYHPAKPIADGYIAPLPFSPEEKSRLTCQLTQCRDIAETVFQILDYAWRSVGGTLLDLKVEFGVLPGGNIVLADVIDCDSWRVVWEGQKLSKQGYRDGDNLDEVLKVYQTADELVSKMLHE